MCFFFWGGGQIPYSPTQSGNRCNVSAVFNKGKYISNGTLKWAFYIRVNRADVLLGFLLLLKVAHFPKLISLEWQKKDTED